MLRPIARRCQPQRHSFCPYHLEVQQEALFKSMKSREEVSLAPCAIVAPQLARPDSGCTNRSGNISSSRCIPCRSFTGFCTCNGLCSLVKGHEGKTPFTYRALFTSFVYQSAQICYIFLSWFTLPSFFVHKPAVHDSIHRFVFLWTKGIQLFSLYIIVNLRK